jgi:hypothetical protein
VVVVRVVLVLVSALEFNGPDVTAAGPHAGDIHPALPELIPPGTRGIIAGINRLTGFVKLLTLLPSP